VFAHKVGKMKEEWGWNQLSHPEISNFRMWIERIMK
jgi:hypothetical protein